MKLLLIPLLALSLSANPITRMSHKAKRAAIRTKVAVVTHKAVMGAMVLGAVVGVGALAAAGGIK